MGLLDQAKCFSMLIGTRLAKGGSVVDKMPSVNLMLPTPFSFLLVSVIYMELIAHFVLYA